LSDYPWTSKGLRGLRVWICVLGCRSNLYEGEALAGELASRGAVVGDSLEGCRAAVIVSCSVTATADKKCRQAVRRARREFGKNEKNGARGVVAVCGCWAQTLSAEEARTLGIDVLIGNRLKHLLPDALEDSLSGGGGFIDMRRDVGTEGTWDSLSLSRPVLRTRAFLKVQEGCDYFCSYCVIPFLRGRPVSRPLEDALEEARRVIGAGRREIVLTGIHLGAWRGGGSDKTEGGAQPLGTLVRRMSALPGLARLRLGSLEPFALDEDLLNALAESPVFCRHLHLPMQSGDDEILERMGRGYTADGFARVCERAREKLGEDLHISSDILVAFPGESERAFCGTLSLMERSGLGRAHVFPYSPRRGTLAARLPGRVSPGVASERVKIAMALGARLLDRYASRFVGTRLSVLAENVKETSHFTGYSRNFLAVSAAAHGSVGAGQESEVRITCCADGELQGERLE
jgi:threonylcarbamoyladenosine tRNA methylthiotransferase MtaB